MSDEDDFNFSEVQLEFQSQPDDERTQKDMTQQTDFETEGTLDNDELSQTETEDFPTSLGATSLAMSSSAAETEDEMTDSTIADDDTDANFEDNLEQYEFDDLPEHACA